ncbi:glycosyl transferase family 2 [Clostridiales bacterium PH28_bin88]|nr:glycosyl transferase family 2 [Clostridiales bacterium PH28_bin88]
MSTRISLCMIVKDEAQNLRRCLNSVTSVADEIIVVDTGSTDNTCQIAQEFGAMVLSFPWRGNFSEARNASLEPATGDWILYLDADEELAKESTAALRRLAEDEAVEGYFCKIINYVGNEGWTDTCPDLVFRLFRNRREHRFRGAIHEQIADVILEKNSKAGFRIAEEIVILHYGYLDKQIEEKDKKNRNLKIIKKELEETPHNRLLRYHYGVELFRAEKYLEAAGEFTQVANGLDPATIYFPKLLRYIVQAYQSAGQPEKALEVAYLGQRFFPDYADLYYYAGLLHLELKQYAKASASFQKAVTMPKQPAQYASFNGVRGFRSYYHLGRIAETLLNYEEALKYYLASLRDDPNFLHSLERIVHILEPHKDPQYAKECLEKAFDFSTPRAYRLIGEMCFREGAYGLALEYLEKTKYSEPLAPEAKLQLVICLIQERRYLEALRLIEEFPPDSPLYPLAKVNKLFCFWIQGNKKKVRNVLAELRALGLSKDTENVLNLLQDALNQRKDNFKAALGQAGTTLLLEIVQRLLAMGEPDKAQLLLSKTDNESIAGQRLAIARLFYRHGYYQAARDILHEHSTTESDDAAHFLLGEIYQATGDYLRAEQHYRNALEINSEDPRYYIKLINLYEERRRQILQEAVQKHPDIEVFKQLSEEASCSR